MLVPAVNVTEWTRTRRQKIALTGE